MRWALRLAVAFEALILLALVTAARAVLGPLLGALGRIPVIGGRIRGLLGHLIDWTTEGWRQALEPVLDRIAGWLGALGSAARGFYVAAAQAVAELPVAFDFFRKRVVPRIVKTLTRVLARVAAQALATAGRALAIALAGAVVFGMAWHEFRFWLYDFVQSEVTPWLRGLESDLRHAITTAAGHTLARAEAWVTTAVLPRVRSLEDTIPGLRIGIRDLGELLRPIREYWQVIAGSFAAVAVVELLRGVARCRQHTGPLHDVDLTFWEELLGLSLLLVAFPHELQAFVRTAGLGLAGLADELGLVPAGGGREGPEGAGVTALATMLGTAPEAQ